MPASTMRRSTPARSRSARKPGKSDFMPLHLQRVLVISCVFRNAEGLKRPFVGRPRAGGQEPGGQGDPELLQDDRASRAAARQLERRRIRPAGAALPRHCATGVVARQVLGLGEDDREFKWNNYIGRYHMRHLDLMDLLAMYQPRANAPLDAMAKLCGFPGKLGMDGVAGVSGLSRGQARGHPTLLRDRRDEHLPAVLPLPEDARRLRPKPSTSSEIALVRDTLAGIDEPHWREYLAAWPAA